MYIVRRLKGQQKGRARKAILRQYVAWDSALWRGKRAAGERASERQSREGLLSNLGPRSCTFFRAPLARDFSRPHN